MNQYAALTSTHIARCANLTRPCAGLNIWGINGITNGIMAMVALIYNIEEHVEVSEKYIASGSPQFVIVPMCVVSKPVIGIINLN